MYRIEKQRSSLTLGLLWLIWITGLCFLIFAIFRLVNTQPRQWVGIDFDITFLWCISYQAYTLQANLKYHVVTIQAHAMFHAARMADAAAPADRQYILVNSLHIFSVIVTTIANWLPLIFVGQELGFRSHLIMYACLSPIATTIPYFSVKDLLRRLNVAIKALSHSPDSPSLNSVTSPSSRLRRMQLLRASILSNGIGYSSAMVSQGVLNTIFLITTVIWPYVGLVWAIFTIFIPFDLISNANALIPLTRTARTTSSHIRQDGSFSPGSFGGIMESIFQQHDNDGTVLVYDNSTNNFVMMRPQELSAMLDPHIVNIVTSGGIPVSARSGATSSHLTSSMQVPAVRTEQFDSTRDIDVVACNPYIVSSKDTILARHVPQLNDFVIRQLNTLIPQTRQCRGMGSVVVVMGSVCGITLIGLVLCGLVTPWLAIMNFIAFLTGLPLLAFAISLQILFDHLAHTSFFRFRVLAIIIEGISFAVILADIRILLVPLLSMFQIISFSTDAFVGLFRTYRIAIVSSTFTTTIMVYLLSQLDLIAHATCDVVLLIPGYTYSNCQFARDAHLATVFFLGFEMLFLARDDHKRFAHITTPIVRDVVHDDNNVGTNIPVLRDAPPNHPVVAAQASTVMLDAGALVRSVGMHRVFVNHLHIRRSSAIAFQVLGFVGLSQQAAFTIVQGLESTWADGCYWVAVLVAGGLLAVLTRPEQLDVAELTLSIILALLGVIILIRASLLYSRTVMILLLRRAYFYFNAGFMALWTTMCLVVLGGTSPGLVVLPLFVFVLYLEDTLDDASVYARTMGFVAIRQAILACLLCSVSVLATLGWLIPATSTWRPILEWRPDTVSQRMNSSLGILDDPSVTDIANQVADMGIGIGVTYLVLPVQVMWNIVTRNNNVKPASLMKHFRGVTAPVEPQFSDQVVGVDPQVTVLSRRAAPELLATTDGRQM